jgi:hypothetical protein
MDFLNTILFNKNYYYGVAILNNTNVKWISIDENTLCCNVYNIVNNIFNVNVKSIENELQKIIPYKSKRKISFYLNDGFYIKCFS